MATLVVLIALACANASSAQAAITHPYTGVSFGPGGVGSGSFGGVVGVAVDQASGDVFVLDKGEGGRVYKFDASGKAVDFSGTGTNVIEGVGSAGVSEEQIAVDSSTGPDAGDVYVANNSVVRIYGADGAFLGELSGGEMCGVGVGSTGEVYVGIYPGTVRRYTPATNPVTNLDESASMGGLYGICNVAVDSAGDVYAATFGGGVSKYGALQFGSLAAEGEAVDPAGRTLAVDPVSGEAFIDKVESIAQYDGTTAPPKLEGTTGAAGEGALSDSFGVGVDHASGELYAGDGETVEIFGAGVVLPDASTEAATGVTGTEATLHGTVEPSGAEVTNCVFEYEAESEPPSENAPCEPATPYTGNAPVAVTAHLSGLREAKTYRYRIVASNANGASHGEEASFSTGGPTVTNEAFSGVGSSSATLSAQVDPRGEPTSYRVEYGTTAAYGSSTPAVQLGAGETPVSAVIHLSELTASTTYHFRFVAVGAEGTATGPDRVFTTHALASSGLPDGRGYELVTPAENEGGEPYAPFGGGAEGETAILTNFPTIAAEDGEAVAYAGSPAASGNGSEGTGLGNQFLARRNPGGGWSQGDIQPPGYASPHYWAFSNN
ncbi:MAG TPA: hypothetical protein VN889_02400, partial [Solirubrobacteraceae bacterium]|nr:hypothetical protein [Solirubrobacteraceae bacterium]